MNIRASIAMAVYNGEKYLNEQIDSIIKMMQYNDELVISYDESQDNTLSIINEYSANDSRVRVVYDSGHSVESNFNNAVANCRGKYIFLADQDDVWIADKINVMVDYFKKNPEIKILISNGDLVNEELEPIGELFKEYKISGNPIRNFIKGTYLGCQMAFDSQLTAKVWPVKVNPPLPHDLWLGVKGAQYGKIGLIDKKLILHRIHKDNYSNTSKMNLVGVIKNRWLFLTELILRR